MALAIIQARLGSTRFPRKVLYPLDGRPLLRHVVERVRAVPSVTSVVVAVPAPDVGPIASAAGPGVAIVGVPGPEHDVLARFAAVVRDRPKHHVVMRVTGDCPRFNPDIAERVIRLFRERRAIYAWNVAPGYVDGEDVEVIDRQALLWAARTATTPEDREHVTPFIRRHFPVETLPPEDDRGWLVKTSIDTRAELAQLRRAERQTTP